MSTPNSKSELEELRQSPERKEPHGPSALLYGFYLIALCLSPILLFAVPIYCFLQGWGLYYILWLLCLLWILKAFKPDIGDIVKDSWRTLGTEAMILRILMLWPILMLLPLLRCLAPIHWLVRKVRGKRPVKRLNYQYLSFYQEVALRAALVHFAVFMLVYDWTAEFRPGTNGEVLHINEESSLAFLLFLTPTLWVPAVYGNGTFSASMLWWGLSCGVSLIFGLIAGRIFAPGLYRKWYGAQERA